ncbi:MAG TPA: glutamate 5-kinase [Sulfuricurvum sp.]|nr:MAG: glutamate 5-kinase [Campylobacterales bacterium 16-40-21]OZA04288.1 MAG: glutamate 5-kinase [Sulfuricurvum sp. 17-40-25]HQS66305.1 glutamate 5-kinase [Sulfuricurvum sp.]HQT35724.1 glutamate 5-kinase [Sulfuricurvum sp.]
MKRLVVKVGSAVLSEQNRIAKERMNNLVDFIAELKSRYEVILVSSGAVAAGYTELKLDKKILANKQALASIGQPILMNKYKKMFEHHNIIPSQILVTAANFNTQEESQKAKDTIETLLQNNVVPIINENDATATEELVLGDNDQLSAYAAYHFDADLLIILSDIDAYYDKDPRAHEDAKVRSRITAIEPDELSREVTPNHNFATGGIVTKLKAADFLLKRGKAMFLASGFDLTDAKSFLLDDVHTGGSLFKANTL